jgi:hypothetical protein
VSASAISGIETLRAIWRQASTLSRSPKMPMSGCPSSALDRPDPVVAAVLKPARSASFAL